MIAVHRRRDVLLADAEGARRRAVILLLVFFVLTTGGDRGDEDGLVAFVRDEHLRREVDVDPLLAGREIPRRRTGIGPLTFGGLHPPAFVRLVE